jgi:t-SNARE complex subunit (syntaxin)
MRARLGILLILHLHTQTDIVAIRNATKRITDINQQAMLATTQEKEAELSNQLEPLIRETNKSAAHAKALLQKMRDDTAALLSDNKPSTKASELRIRDNLSNTLTRKFVDVMKEYQNAQQKYKTDIKKKVKRQVQIVNPDATSGKIVLLIHY